MYTQQEHCQGKRKVTEKSEHGKKVLTIHYLSFLQLQHCHKPNA